MSLPTQPPEEVQRQPWDQLPGEPALWYGRFCRYRDLGPSRSMVAAARAESEAKHKHPWPPSESWARAARTWQWCERARAWDAHQREVLTLCEYNVRLAARNRRVAITQENIDLAREGIELANLPGMTQEEARAALPFLRKFLVDMLKAQRKEFETPIFDDRAHDRPITADDLRAAMRALEEQAEELDEEAPPGHRPERGAAPWPDELPGARLPRDRRLRLFLCLALGAAAGPLDAEAMRARGLPLCHIYDADCNKFRKAFTRERDLRRPIELLQIDLRSSAEGIEFANGLTPSGWRIRHGEQLRIVVLGQYSGPDPGAQGNPGRPAWCAGIPNIITLAAEMPPATARTFAQHFWAAVAGGSTPAAAAQGALAAIPPAARSCVVADVTAHPVVVDVAGNR
jgi:hypothetical protein